jgi:hypothetical protein
VSHIIYKLLWELGHLAKLVAYAQFMGHASVHAHIERRRRNDYDLTTQVTSLCRMRGVLV